MVYTELISAEGLFRGGKKTRALMRIFDDERPVGIQLFGKNPDTMADAARKAEELSPDIIDINMGCCAQKVCSNGAGAALARNVDLLYTIAKRITEAVRVPVTAKIRLGWDDSSRNHMEMLRALEDAGVCAVTVHGRTRAQQYSGRADWDAIEEIASAARIPVIGNGDIRSHADALLWLQETSCSAVMIGRSALGNPWIFDGSVPSLEDRIETVRKHIRDMVSYYGEYGIILARKHAVRYFHHQHSASAVRKELVRAQTENEMNRILDHALETVTP